MAEVIELPYSRIAPAKISSFGSPNEPPGTVNLVHSSDNEPGIIRVKRAGKFVYLMGTKTVRNKRQLERIKKLVIPPAWENVWICKEENGHLQCTGLDKKGRKQYKYHTIWSSFRNQAKFLRLYDFGKAVPRIRERIERDLSLRGLPLEKVLAAVICLMERTASG